MRLVLKRKVKLVLYLILFFFLVGMIIFEINYSNKTLKKKSITYSKESNISYRVYLKNNNHYTSSYLKDDYNYVASLIDYFNIDYDYSYVLSEPIEYVLNYQVDANLEIYDSDVKNKPIEKKDYELVKKVTTSNTGQLIKVDLYNQKILYDTYSKIIDEWKKDVSPDATLKITFKVDWVGYSNVLGKEIGDTYTNTFEIPVSNKIITINTPNAFKDSGTLYVNQSFGTNFYLLIGSTLLLLLLVLIGTINTIIKINKNKSRYEQKIKKILREFDRAITEAKGKFVKDKKEHYIEVKEFMELMDVHDNLNEPIIYYRNSNNKSIFVVRNGNDVYYSLIRRDDFE